MKRLILACGLVGAIATAQAHPEGGPRPLDSQKRVENLQKVLQLNDEQTAKVKKILEDSDQQRKALMEKYKPQLDAYHADMKSQGEKTRAQIDSVLTAPQKEAFKAQNEKREGFMRRMHERGGPAGDGPGAPNDGPE